MTIKLNNAKAAFEQMITVKCMLESEEHNIKDKSSTEYQVVKAKLDTIIAVIDSMSYGFDMVEKVTK